MAYLNSAKKAAILAQFGTVRAGFQSAMSNLLDEVAAAIAADAPDTSKPALKALGVIRIAAAVQDGETVVIGDDTYELDTDGDYTEGNIQVDLSGGSGVKAQGTLTLDTQPTPGDTMTLGSKTYTFVPNGTANADGEISVGTDLATAQAALKDAVNGDDAHNTAHPLVTCGAFASDDAIIEAITPGTAGNSIASTETFTAGTNVFDAATLGTTQAGVDPTAAEASAALETAINASGTEAITADKISDNEVLLLADVAGVLAIALSETMGGTNNVVDTSTMRGGAVAGQVQVATVSRVPNATEAALGNLHIPLDFAPTTVLVEVKVTATGAIKDWDGDIIITSDPANYITLNNDGSTDWDASDTINVIAIA